MSLSNVAIDHEVAISNSFDQGVGTTADEVVGPFLHAQELADGEASQLDMTEDQLQATMVNQRPVKYKEKTAELGSLLPFLPTPSLRSVTDRAKVDIHQLPADLFEAEEKVEPDSKEAAPEDDNLNPRLKALKRFSEIIKISENKGTTPTAFKSISTRVLVETVKPPQPIAANPDTPPLIERETAETPAAENKTVRVKYDQLDTANPGVAQPPMPQLKSVSAKIKINAEGTHVAETLDADVGPQKITSLIQPKVKFGHLETPPPEMPQVPLPTLKALPAATDDTVPLTAEMHPPVETEAVISALSPQPIAELATPIFSPAPDENHVGISVAPVVPPALTNHPLPKSAYASSRIPVQPPETILLTPTPSRSALTSYDPPIQPLRNVPSDKIPVTPGRVFSTGTTQPIPLNPRSHPAVAPSLWIRFKLWMKKSTKRWF
jgi:hypothetical protein